MFYKDVLFFQVEKYRQRDTRFWFNFRRCLDTNRYDINLLDRPLIFLKVNINISSQFSLVAVNRSEDTD